MTEEVPPADLLPLLFTTALVVYVLAMGSIDLARSIIRIGALTCAAFCLAVWAAAALNYGTWGAPMIDDFYATAVVSRTLGQTPAGWLLALLSLVVLMAAARETWRLKVARLRDQ